MLKPKVPSVPRVGSETMQYVSPEVALSHLEDVLQPPPVMPTLDREQVEKIVGDVLAQQRKKMPASEVFFRVTVSLFLKEIHRKRHEESLSSWTVQISTVSREPMTCTLIGNDPLGVIVELHGSGSGVFDSMSDSVTRIAWDRIVALQCNDLCDETAWDHMKFEILGHPAEPMGKAEHAIRADLGMVMKRGQSTVLQFHLINGQEITGEIARLNEFGCLLRSAETKTRGMDDLFFLPWTSIDFYDLDRRTAEDLGLIPKRKK